MNLGLHLRMEWMLCHLQYHHQQAQTDQMLVATCLPDALGVQMKSMRHSHLELVHLQEQKQSKYLVADLVQELNPELVGLHLRGSRDLILHEMDLPVDFTRLQFYHDHFVLPEMHANLFQQAVYDHLDQHDMLAQMLHQMVTPYLKGLPHLYGVLVHAPNMRVKDQPEQWLENNVRVLQPLQMAQMRHALVQHLQWYLDDLCWQYEIPKLQEDYLQGKLVPELEWLHGSEVTEVLLKDLHLDQWYRSDVHLPHLEEDASKFMVKTAHSVLWQYVMDKRSLW